MFCKSKIVPIRKEEVKIRLFDEEIDVAQFTCFQLNLSYEQLFMKLVREYAERNYANNKNYEFII